MQNKSIDSENRELHEEEHSEEKVEESQIPKKPKAENYRLTFNTEFTKIKKSTFEKLCFLPYRAKFLILNYLDFTLDNQFNLFFILEANQLSFFSDIQLKNYLNLFRPAFSSLSIKSNIFRCLACMRDCYKQFFNYICTSLASKINKYQTNKTSGILPSEYGEFDNIQIIIDLVFNKFWRTSLFKNLINSAEKVHFYDLILRNIANLIDYYEYHKQLGQIYIIANEGMDYLDDLFLQFFDKESKLKYKERFDHFYRTFHTSMERAKNKSNFRRRVTRFSYLPFRGLKKGVIIKANPSKGFAHIFEQSQILLYHVGSEEDTHGLVINKEFCWDDKWQLMGGPCDPEKVFVLHNIKGVPGALQIKKGLFLGGSVVEYLLIMWDVFQKVQKKGEFIVDWGGGKLGKVGGVKGIKRVKESIHHFEGREDDVLLSDDEGRDSKEPTNTYEEINESEIQETKEAHDPMIPSITQLDSQLPDLQKLKAFLANTNISHFLQFKSTSLTSSSSLISNSQENLRLQSNQILKTLTSKVLKRLEDHTVISEYQASDYIEDSKLKFFFEEKIRDLEKSREQRQEFNVNSESQLNWMNASQEEVQGRQFGSLLNQIFRSAVQRNYSMSSVNLIDR